MACESVYRRLEAEAQKVTQVITATYLDILFDVFNDKHPDNSILSCSMGSMSPPLCR